MNRTILDNDHYGDPVAMHVLMTLILMAESSGVDTVDVSIRALAAQTGLSYQTMRTTLSHLVSWGELTQKSTQILTQNPAQRLTSITICKLERYTSKQKTSNAKSNATSNAASNASRNTTSANNIEERKRSFGMTLQEFLLDEETGSGYPRPMLNDFFVYWTEKNSSGKKMRFELEKTWELSARLRVWASNDNKFERNATRQQPNSNEAICQRLDEYAKFKSENRAGTDLEGSIFGPSF